MELECIASLPLRLEVGKSYRDAEGVRVDLFAKWEDDGDFVGYRAGKEVDRHYRPTGEHWCGDYPPIVSLWDSPPLPALQPDSGGWIEWKGGECPVMWGAQGMFRRRDGKEFDLVLATLWRHEQEDHDIIAYKLAPAEPAKAVVHPAPSARTGAQQAERIRAPLTWQTSTPFDPFKGFFADWDETSATHNQPRPRAWPGRFVSPDLVRV